MRDKASRVGRMSGGARTHPEFQVNIPMTLDIIAFQVHSSGYSRAGIGWSYREDLNTGRHEKAPVRCQCSRLAALHGVMKCYYMLLEM